MTRTRTATTNLTPRTWSGLKPFCPVCDSQRLDFVSSLDTGKLAGVFCHDCKRTFRITPQRPENKS